MLRTVLLMLVAAAAALQPTAVRAHTNSAVLRRPAVASVRMEVAEGAPEVAEEPELEPPAPTTPESAPPTGFEWGGTFYRPQPVSRSRPIFAMAKEKAVKTKEEPVAEAPEPEPEPPAPTTPESAPPAGFEWGGTFYRPQPVSRSRPIFAMAKKKAAKAKTKEEPVAEAPEPEPEPPAPTTPESAPPTGFEWGGTFRVPLTARRSRPILAQEPEEPAPETPEEPEPEPPKKPETKPEASPPPGFEWGGTF